VNTTTGVELVVGAGAAAELEEDAPVLGAAGVEEVAGGVEEASGVEAARGREGVSKDEWTDGGGEARRRRR
jgi:hypothetical protein